MKKSVLLTAICLLLALSGCTGKSAEISASDASGRCLAFDNGSYALLTEDNAVIVMADASEGGELFRDLRTGDRIQVTHGPVRETYPEQTDVYMLEVLCHDADTALPQEVLYTLTAMGWKLKNEKPLLSAVTEPYSGESVLPVELETETETEPYFHLNSDRIEPLETPDRVTVIAEFREQMGETPSTASAEQASAIVRKINALELTGYDLEQSRFPQLAGGGYLVRLYYGDQVVTFNFGTDWSISVQYPDDPQKRWFMDNSGNFDALIELLYPILTEA